MNTEEVNLKIATLRGWTEFEKRSINLANFDDGYCWVGLNPGGYTELLPNYCGSIADAWPLAVEGKFGVYPTATGGWSAITTTTKLSEACIYLSQDASEAIARLWLEIQELKNGKLGTAEERVN